MDQIQEERDNAHNLLNDLKQEKNHEIEVKF